MTCNYCQKRCTSNHVCETKYRFDAAVAWIAANDDATETDADTVAGQTSVLLVADLFNQGAMYVARCVLNKRNPAR